MLGGPERLFVESKFASPAPSPFTEQTARMPSSVVLQRVSSVVLNLMDRQEDNSSSSSSSTKSGSRTQEDNKHPHGLCNFSTSPEVNHASVKSAEMIESFSPPQREHAFVSTGTNEKSEMHSAASTVDKEEKPGGAQPQHLDAANTYHRDMDFEVTLLRHRNKRVLMSRLQEVSPRGRLSLVSYQSFKYNFC
jgi:hypothetical protein